MWQVAVAAAVAGGSGFLAKHLFSQPNNAHNQTNPEEQYKQDQTLEHQGVSHNNPTNSPIFSAQTLLAQNHQKESTSSICEEGQEEDGVFRFSSSGSRKARVLGKKKSKKNVSGVIRREKIVGRLKHASYDQRKNLGKRVSICLKRRKTSSRASKESGDSACSKDQSAFGWGLGLGIIYMMSAGKTEVSKLSQAIDDTAKVVHELKSELNKQKSSQFLGKVDDTTNITQKLTTKKTNIESSTSNKHSIINTKVITHSLDSEYASSVLTEEHQPEGGEMDQLEAELESELQKLPWCGNEMSEHEGIITNAEEIERRESMTQRAVAYQSGGVSPAELKNKLSHLLIKQQEGHITELESELNLAYSKLQEKEAELRALKDCVKRLTEFSLSTVSDEETEARAAKEENVELASDNSGSQNAVVGMKRSLGFGICDY